MSRGALFQLQQLTATLTQGGGAGPTLQRIAERVRRVSGAQAVYIERIRGADRPSEVVASTGAPAPAPGARSPHAAVPGLRATRISVDNGSAAPLGTVVLLGAVDGSDPVRTTRRLALLVDVARLALHVSALADEVQARRQEQEQAIEEKYRLISGITYELKETLGVAAEYVQLLDTETELTERQREYIESNRRTMSAAVRLIGDLLELARVEAGRLRVNREPTSLGALVRDMARDYRLASATYGVRVETDVTADLPIVHTDPDLVGQILDNLLSNAVRYTPANGVIRMRADTQPGRRAGDPKGWVRVTVIDSGPGVNDTHDVFEAIERVSGHRGAPGFRLAISRNVARLLGGDLTLERTAGEGASFTLWLPLDAGDEAR